MNWSFSERQRYNAHYWSTKKLEFPFHAQAPTLEPSPTDVAKQFEAEPLYFLAVPMGDETTYWGFERAADRAEFFAAYPNAKLLLGADDTRSATS